MRVIFIALSALALSSSALASTKATAPVKERFDWYTTFDIQSEKDYSLTSSFTSATRYDILLCVDQNANDVGFNTKKNPKDGGTRVPTNSCTFIQGVLYLSVNTTGGPTHGVAYIRAR